MRDKSRTGVVTTNTRKELYAMETQKYMTQESVHFWEHLVVANPSGTANEEKRCLEEFKKQLMGFKRVICHPQRGYSLPKVIYTGKSQGAKDDLVMTLLIGVFWLTEFHMPSRQARKYFFFAFPFDRLLTDAQPMSCLIDFLILCLFSLLKSECSITLFCSSSSFFFGDRQVLVRLIPRRQRAQPCHL